MKNSTLGKLMIVVIACCMCIDIKDVHSPHEEASTKMQNRLLGDSNIAIIRQDGIYCTDGRVRTPEEVRANPAFRAKIIRMRSQDEIWSDPNFSILYKWVK